MSSSCDFFKNLLQKNFKESFNETIRIHNITPKIFEYILTFIYLEEEFRKLPTNSIKEEEWIALLQAAHYLNFSKLQLFCENCISEEILNAKNVLYLIELSFLLNCETLENNCLIYVADK